MNPAPRRPLQSHCKARDNQDARRERKTDGNCRRRERFRSWPIADISVFNRPGFSAGTSCPLASRRNATDIGALTLDEHCAGRARTEMVHAAPSRDGFERHSAREIDHIEFN